MRLNFSILYLKRSFLGPLMAVVSMLVFCQSMMGDTVDSLYRVYHNAEKAHRYEVVNQMSSTLYHDEITDSLYQLKSSSKPELVEAIMHYLMAEHYYDMEQYEAALNEGKQAHAFTQRRKADKLSSDVLGVLSNAQFRLEDYNGALQSLLEAYKVDKKLGNKELLSSDLNSLAAIYLAVGQPEPGIHFIEKAIAMERELGRRDRLATRLGIASELYLLNNDPDNAMRAIKEAYMIDHQSGKTEKAAVRLVQKAEILKSMSRLDEAYSTIMQALPELVKADNTYSLAIAYNQLGAIEQKLGHNDQATAYYKKGLEQSIRCGAPKVERAAERGLWETMRKSNPNAALIHLERYTTLNDSMQNKMQAMRMQVIETTAYTVEQKELNKKSELFSSLLKWGGLALLVMLAALLTGMFFLWRRGKKALHMQQQVQDMRSHFFSNITNELQTPLTVVMGAGQQLLEIKKSSIEENHRLGEMIVRHGTNMLNLVNHLLDIEKVRTAAQAPWLKHGDVVLFLQLLVDNYTAEARQHLISLDFTSTATSLYVVFAPDYLRKITHRLIANAIRYTPRNGAITVKLSTPESGKMRLTVSDTGKGIPAEERRRIFEPFTQSSNGDEGVETVVDLALVNQLVRALNGTIIVDSELGKGTVFTIDIPVQTLDEKTLADEVLSHRLAENRIINTGKSKQKPLVFIVEDNEDVAYLIAYNLQDKYELRFAHDGQEALNNARELVPALFITSTRLPLMGGKELIRLIRDDATLNHIPVIAMTPIADEQERMSCIEAGADAVLVKPFNTTELVLQTDHLINQNARMRERLTKTTHEIAQKSSSTPMSKEDKDFINRLVDVIHAQMAKDDIDMEHIAAAMLLSPKQLRSRVMAITGMTTVAYILQVRLNYARRMITSENTSLTIIATKCGFQNLSHFSKAFKQQFGVSPMQFRKNYDDVGQGLPPVK